MSDQTALMGLENPSETTDIFGNYGAGPTEKETRQAIAEIETDIPLIGARRTIKQLAISLAISIDKGNAKGRAIANEANQLFVMIRELSPAEDDSATNSDQMTEPTRRLFNAFASAPRLDTPPQSDGPQF